jgi:recombination associated protein RdgC
MFKTISFYRLENFQSPDLDALEQAMAGGAFVPCTPTQPESSGWVAPRGKKSVTLAERVGGHLLLQLCTERRALPASAINAALEERIEKYMEETGRERVGGKMKKQFKEEVVQDLLPRAFSKRSSTLVWLDAELQMLVLNTSSNAISDKVISLLIDALANLPGRNASFIVKPVQTQLAPATCMAQWLSSRDAPPGFTVDQDCELKTPDDRKSSVRYARHTLEIDEISQHITEGKLPTQLAMTWNSRVSFVLNDKGQVKKIKLLDVVMEGVKESGEDGFDADAAIATGELCQLIPDLLDALGGEMDAMAAPVTAPVMAPTVIASPKAPSASGGSGPTPPWEDAAS